MITAGLPFPRVCFIICPLIEYSVNARGYMLMLSIFLAMLALATFLRNSYNRFGWGLFIGLGMLGFCALPIMVYPCGIICGWLLLDTYCSATKHKMKFVILMGVSIAFMAALTMIIYWPVLVVSGSQEVLGNYYTISHAQFFQGLFPYVRTLAGIWFQELATNYRVGRVGVCDQSAIDCVSVG